MTDQLAPLRSVLDEAPWDLDDTAVIDLQPITEQVVFTPAPETRNVGGTWGNRTVRYLPPVGWVPSDPSLPLGVFEQVDAAFQWRTPKGRVSRRRGYNAHMGAPRCALDGGGP